MQPRIYTYKITFEGSPYWYWGVHKEKLRAKFTWVPRSQTNGAGSYTHPASKSWNSLSTPTKVGGKPGAWKTA
jgi:hypothetical protein